MIKPIHTLLFLVAVGAACLGMMWVFPDEGIIIQGDWKLKFAKIEDFQSIPKDTASLTPIENVNDLLELYEDISDSLVVEDTLKLVEKEKRQALLKIQFKNDNANVLNNFFEALNETKANGTKMRVLHYGDSQIEGDRISGYLRNQLQKEFGGIGPGLLPAYEVIPTASINQTNSDNWLRYTIFGKKDSTVTHNGYGLLANFGRYAPINPEDTSTYKGWVNFEPSNITYNRSKKFDKVKVFFGKNDSNTSLKLKVDDVQTYTKIIDSQTHGTVIAWDLENTAKSLTFEFESKGSPDICAFSLEGKSGVNLDNIAMRGSSGTIFKRIDYDQLKTHYASLNTKLVLLQFGGNTVPYIESIEKAEQYGNWFKSQIKYLKKLLPESSFILIGPSDMATKDMDKFVSYPFLSEVRDVLKEAAFDTGCGFWDIYEVMGGHNSMEKWVNNDPPLAGKDYVHFTPKGARKIAELFYKELMQEYTTYQRIQAANQVLDQHLKLLEK